MMEKAARLKDQVEAVDEAEATCGPAGELAGQAGKDGQGGAQVALDVKYVENDMQAPLFVNIKTARVRGGDALQEHCIPGVSHDTALQ
jgi:hypothetical protein